MRQDHVTDLAAEIVGAWRFDGSTTEAIRQYETDYSVTLTDEEQEAAIAEAERRAGTSGSMTGYERSRVYRALR